MGSDATFSPLHILLDLYKSVFFHCHISLIFGHFCQKYRTSGFLELRIFVVSTDMYYSRSFDFCKVHSALDYLGHLLESANKVS